MTVTFNDDEEDDENISFAAFDLERCRPFSDSNLKPVDSRNANYFASRSNSSPTYKPAYPTRFGGVSLSYPGRPSAGDSVQSYLLLPIMLGLCPYLFSAIFGAETFWMEFSFLVLVLFWLYLNSTVPWNLYSICVRRREEELVRLSDNFDGEDSKGSHGKNKITLWQMLEFVSIVGLFATPFIAAYGVMYFQTYYSEKFGIGLLSTFNVHLFVLAGLIIPLRYFFGVGYPTRITRESAPAFVPHKDAAVLPLPPTYLSPSVKVKRKPSPSSTSSTLIDDNDVLNRRLTSLEKEIRSLQVGIYSIKHGDMQNGYLYQRQNGLLFPANVLMFVLWNVMFYSISFCVGFLLLPFRISKSIVNLILSQINKLLFAKYIQLLRRLALLPFIN